MIKQDLSAIEPLLKQMISLNASDLFITAGVAPTYKVHGKLQALDAAPLTPEQSKDMVYQLMSDAERTAFTSNCEANFAISLDGTGRFRASAFLQRGMVGMVIRRIETVIPKFEELNLPPILEQLAMSKHGLVLFVGAMGTGKSTTLAATTGYRNRHSSGHIISIEDPIEFIHQHEGCIITQREIGLDTLSYAEALKNTLRQSPDVVLLSEIRTTESMEYALTFAETGHLCLATLHAQNAAQALERIVSMFPSERHHKIWMDLSFNLRAIIAQQLVPSADGKGRVATVEVLLNTPLAAEYIRKGNVLELKSLMKRSVDLGMRTFDQDLYELYMQGEISYEDALAHADSTNDLRLMIKLASENDGNYLSAVAENLDLDISQDPDFNYFSLP